MAEQRSTSRRVDDGHIPPCPLLQTQIDLADEIKEDLKAIKEMLEAWNNAKGFVRTMQVIASVAKWVAIIGGGITVLTVWWRR